MSLHDPKAGLKYKGLSIVFFHLFRLENACGASVADGACVKEKPADMIIDHQIFHYDNLDEKPIKNYALDGFSFDLRLKNPCPNSAECTSADGHPCKAKDFLSDKEPCGDRDIHISGKIQVEMALYYRWTVSLTYRMVIDDNINMVDLVKHKLDFIKNEKDDQRIREAIKFVKSSDLLTTDQLIALISLFSIAIKAEHWTIDDKPTQKKLKRLAGIAKEADCLHPLYRAIRCLSRRAALEPGSAAEDDLKQLGASDNELDLLRMMLEVEQWNAVVHILADRAKAHLKHTRPTGAPLEEDEKNRLIREITEADDGAHIDSLTYASITLEADARLAITHLWLDENGEPTARGESLTLAGEKPADLFEQVFRRYQHYVLRLCAQKSAESAKTKSAASVGLPSVGLPSIESTYVFVDIWETFQHDGYNVFEEMDEPSIISHILDQHKSELMGLMSLYPNEWAYRDSVSYNDVCGENIAIDTDDLVLANQKICVVFGTYGSRGDEEDSVDWVGHLSIRAAFHVSWPEYLLILEMLLVKKHTIKYLNAKNEWLIESATKGSKKDMHDLSAEIEATTNTYLAGLTELVKLDAVKYIKFVSHKIMHDATGKRLAIDTDRADAEAIMERLDTSLKNKRETAALRQSDSINLLLMFLSAASLLQIIMQIVLSDGIRQRIQAGLSHYLGDRAEGIVEAAVQVIMALEGLFFVLCLFLIAQVIRGLLKLRFLARLY